MADPIITSTNTGNRGNNLTMTGNQAAARNNPGQAGRSVGQMSSYGVAKSGMNQIRQGDVIRGEISDLRNNEITITLENNTLIKGQIADSSSLSIGQTAAFRLSSVSPSGVMLDAIPNSYTETELTLINKALNEASLPATERNQSAVKALMDNLMPINKQSIQQLMQQAYDLGTEDMETLCLMNRKQYQVTADSVAQFSAYRNGTHSLLARVETFSNQIPELLETLAENGPSNIVAMFGEKLLSIALADDDSAAAGRTNADTASALPTIADLSEADLSSLKTMLSETPMTDEQLAAFQSSTMTGKEAALLIQKAITGQTIVLSEHCPAAELQAKSDEILQLLNPQPASSLSEELTTLESVLSGKIAESTETDAILPDASSDAANSNAAEASADSASARSFAGRLFHNLSDAARSSFQNINEMLAAPHDGSTNITHTPAVIDTLLSGVTSFGRQNSQLFLQLTPEMRSELARYLHGMGVDSGITDRVLSGDISATDTLAAIKNSIAHSDSALTQNLFQTEAFRTLFQNVLLDSFTISPHRLAKTNEPDSFYQSMEQKMNSFETLINTTLSGSDSGQLSGQAHDMQGNIDFMKSLNQAFAYMQLPLKLQNQNAHGDLYVYTKKDKMKQNPQKLSLMLHLEKEDSLRLIERNTHLLTDSLAEKGYTCQVQVQPLTQSETPVQDFLNAKVTPSASHEMKRFSFDIRA